TFLKDSTYFKPEQLKVTGSVKLDVYRHLLKKNSSAEDFVLGFAFSVRVCSSFEGCIRYAQMLHGFDEKSHLPMVPKGRHWEDYAWRDFAILRRMMNIIKRYMETTNGKIYLRV